MKTFISLSITLTGYYIASGQFDLQYCGGQQYLKLFQEIWSALHDSVLSGGGYSVRFKAVGNMNPACDSKVMGSLQVEDEMKKICYCELSVCDSVIIVTSTQEIRN